ncbi:hypothetical protein LTR50_006576 [Elasticomyces elasticus]|nr:hypothetical protein LTR50_006576 [Elasticomyces elasticus]
MHMLTLYLSTGSHTSPPDVQALQNALDESNNRIQDLLAFQQSQAEQIEDHQRTLQGVTEKIRNYSFEHTNTTIALHAHYQSLLTTSRAETLQLQLQHQGWQAALSRAAEYARLALRERSEDVLPYRRKIARLKDENAILRRKVGWTDIGDSDEEVDEGLGGMAVVRGEKDGRGL